MKQLIKLLFLFLPLLVQAKDINVAAGGSISAANNSAVAGDRILAAAATFTDQINLKPGVSLIGAGIDKTIILNYSFNWWKGAIDLAPGADGGGQVLEGFTLRGDPNKSFEGIHIQRSNVAVRNVKVERFYYSGIEVQSLYEQTLSNVVIDGFQVIESSKESTAGSFGNIILRGQLSNVSVMNGSITHKTNVPVASFGEKSSGYGIKCFSNYGTGFSSNETQTNCRVVNVSFDGKQSAPWGADVPNFSMEIWNVHVDNFEIARCIFRNQLSLEHGGQKTVGRSFYVHDNTFQVMRGQSIELTASHSVVEKNKFTMAGNTNPWNFIGTYNSQANLRNITFKNNTIDLAGTSPIILCAKGQYINFLMEGNVFTGSGSPTLVEFRSGSVGSTVIARDNVFPKNLKQLSFNGITANQISLAFTPGSVVVPTEPVIKPPVIEPPVVVPPVTIVKTITITKERVYKAPVVSDDGKGSVVITIQYENKETKTEQ